MRLKRKLYEVGCPDGKGIMTPEEWASQRRCSELKALYEAPTDENYKRVVASRPDKAKLAHEVIKVLEYRTVLTQSGSIGEIGGAPYIQASIIREEFPHLKYLATDQDEISNAILSQVPTLSNLAIKTFNVKTGDLSVFDDCDLLISFAVDYALEDEDLEKIFAYLGKTGKQWAILSVSCISPLKSIRMAVGDSIREWRRVPYRHHGWARGLDDYRELADRHGVKVEYLGVVCGDTGLLTLTA